MMPFLNLLHRYKLKHLVVLCAVSVALLFLMVLVLMPRPDSLKHSLLWQNGSGNTPRELSQAYDDAFFFNSTDDELNNSSEEERDYDENAGKVDEDGDEEEGEEEEGEQEDEAMEMMKTSHPDASLVAGNSRAVCIGSNASLGEVEDLLCMVSAFPVGGVGVTVAVVIDVVVVIVAGVVVIVVYLLLPS